MAEPQRITDADFHAADGVDEWRALFWGAKAHYLTGDFGRGAEFVAGIATIVEDLDHPPMIDFRMDTVTVTVLTLGVGLSDRDLGLARRISALAASLGIPSDPSAVQHVQLAVDAADPEPVIAFWQAALGYARVGPEDLVDKNLIGPSMWFQEKTHVAPRNRLHVDVSLPHDEAQARIAAIVAAGGRVLGDKHAPAWVSLIDPEGNVVDVVTWQGRD